MSVLNVIERRTEERIEERKRKNKNEHKKSKKKGEEKKEKKTRQGRVRKKKGDLKISTKKSQYCEQQLAFEKKKVQVSHYNASGNVLSHICNSKKSFKHSEAVALMLH